MMPPSEVQSEDEAVHRIVSDFQEQPSYIFEEEEDFQDYFVREEDQDRQTKQSQDDKWFFLHNRHCSFEDLECKDKFQCCIICLEDCHIEDTSTIITTLFCKHAFHKECIQTWLTGSTLCPLCKRDFREYEAYAQFDADYKMRIPQKWREDEFLQFQIDFPIYRPIERYVLRDEPGFQDNFVPMNSLSLSNSYLNSFCRIFKRYILQKMMDQMYQSIIQWLIKEQKQKYWSQLSLQEQHERLIQRKKLVNILKQQRIQQNQSEFLRFQCKFTKKRKKYISPISSMIKQVNQRQKHQFRYLRS